MNTSVQVQVGSGGSEARAGSGAIECVQGKSGWARWWAVVVYAVAMAWVESAVVLYLRTLTGQMNPYPPPAIFFPKGIGIAELIRELATLVMLGAVGCLAGRTWRSRFAYALLGFGVWDIFYYIFLVPLTGWPRSLLDWDILFLLPLPWWGPVIAPVLIASLMILGGTLVGLIDRPSAPFWPARWSVLVNVLGILVALYVFMEDALRVVGQGIEALQRVFPKQFDWPLFCLAIGLMLAPMFDLARQLKRRSARRAMPPSAPVTVNPMPEDRVEAST